MSKDLIFHEFVVLRNILNIQTEKNTPLYPSDLSDRLNLSRSYVTSVLNSLEKKNLINRTVDLTDRRRILIFITDKGQQILII
jgi:DNA-binding MarR family transcriptional regulator